MPALKCPNPSCPYLFDPAQVPAGALLACPRCGQRFKLSPASSSATEFVTPDQPEPAPKRRARSSLGGTLMAIGGSLLLLGILGVVIVAAGLAKRPNLDTGSSPNRSEFVVADKNFAYRFPEQVWKLEPQLQDRLGVTAFALKRTEEPTGWAALSVTDYRNRTPSLGELQEKMLTHLQQEFVNLPANLEPSPTPWGGQAARIVRFRGEQQGTGTICRGEAYLLAFRGIGYWFYTWAPEHFHPALEAELQDLAARFRVLDERKDWQEQARSETVYPVANGTHQISTGDTIWKSPPGLKPQDEEATADLLLWGELRSGSRQEMLARATVIVYTLAESDSDKVRDYVKKRHTPDETAFGKTVIEELKAADNATNEPSEVIRLHVRPEDPNAARSAQKLVIFKSLVSENQAVVAEGWCSWSERSLLEEKIAQIVASLRSR